MDIGELSTSVDGYAAALAAAYGGAVVERVRDAAAASADAAVLVRQAIPPGDTWTVKVTDKPRHDEECPFGHFSPRHDGFRPLTCNGISSWEWL